MTAARAASMSSLQCARITAPAQHRVASTAPPPHPRPTQKSRRNLWIAIMNLMILTSWLPSPSRWCGLRGWRPLKAARPLPFRGLGPSRSGVRCERSHSGEGRERPLWRRLPSRALTKMRSRQKSWNSRQAVSPGLPATSTASVVTLGPELPHGCS
jgi:hypothetical protein